MTVPGRLGDGLRAAADRVKAQQDAMRDASERIARERAEAERLSTQDEPKDGQ